MIQPPKPLKKLHQTHDTRVPAISHGNDTRRSNFIHRSSVIIAMLI